MPPATVSSGSSENARTMPVASAAVVSGSPPVNQRTSSGAPSQVAADRTAPASSVAPLSSLRNRPLASAESLRRPTRAGTRTAAITVTIEAGSHVDSVSARL